MWLLIAAMIVAILAACVAQAVASDGEGSPAGDKKKEEILTRATTGTTRRCTVPLNELTLLPEKYCHREPEELKPEALQLLCDSLVLEGLRVPPVFFTNAQGQKIVTCGYRRVIGLRTLAERNQPGFSLTMLIEAIEVVGATRLDHLVQSLSDNYNRSNPSPTRRLHAVKALHDEGAEVRLAARTLGVSDATYSRDLRIVKLDWAYAYVEKNAIAPTVASKLLEAAEKADRTDELKEVIDQWVDTTDKQVKDKARRYKAEGKDMKAGDLVIKNLMKKELVDNWLSCIEDKRPFDDKAEWQVDVGIDDDGRLKLTSLTLDLNKAPAEQQAKLASRLIQVGKQALIYAQERAQIERHREQASFQAEPYAFGELRQAGLGDIAERLEKEYRLKLQAAPDGEDAAQAPEEERAETDLASSIELPGQGTEPAAPATEPEAPTPVATTQEDQPAPAPKPESESTEQAAPAAPKGKGKAAK